MRAGKLVLMAMMTALPAMAQTAAATATATATAPATAPVPLQSSGAAMGAVLGSLIGPVFDILMQPTVTGEPYTATRATLQQHKLEDGTTISRHSHHFIARDAEGRVRMERVLIKATSSTPAVKMIYVKDPVAGTLTRWTEGGAEMPGQEKTATVVKLPDMSKDAAKAALGTEKGTQKETPKHEHATTEQLGQQSIQGVMVTGVRTTTIVPAGKVGNDQPLTETDEIWTAPDLRLVVREVETDPRSGTTTHELENLSREDPPIATFQPPAGYAVKDMDAIMKDAKAKAAAAQAQPQP